MSRCWCPAGVTGGGSPYRPVLPTQSRGFGSSRRCGKSDCSRSPSRALTVSHYTPSATERTGWPRNHHRDGGKEADRFRPSTILKLAFAHGTVHTPRY